MNAPKFSIILRPVADSCDLNCRYCVRQGSSGCMTMETAQTLLRQVFDMTAEGGDINISFQGGEPTLAGIEFYREFTALAERLCPPGCHLFWGMQTHGLNLDDRWIDLFLKHDFEVSVSVDGYQAIHEENRGAGTWKPVRSVFRRLLERDVVVNALCVITRQSSRRPEMIYESLRKLGVSNIIFRPCADHGQEQAWSLTPPHLANFLCRVFDVWYDDWEKGKYCFVNLFDDAVRVLQGREAADCTVCGRCGETLVIDADGSIYPCEKYVGKEHRIGAVGEDGIAAALRSPQFQAFLEKGRRKPDTCRMCSRNKLCGGGCRDDWSADRKGNRNIFCDAYKRFFLYAVPRLAQIAEDTAAN